jgi:hypothetical protein
MRPEGAGVQALAEKEWIVGGSRSLGDQLLLISALCDSVRPRMPARPA